MLGTSDWVPSQVTPCAGGCQPDRRNETRLRLSLAAQSHRVADCHRGEAVVTELARGSAVQDPVSALPATYGAGAHELSERSRDRWSVRADKVGKPLVRKRQWHDDTVLAYAAPALGEVPQREHQAVIDAGMMGDRKRDGERVRPAGPAVEELDSELRPRGDTRDKLLVEHGQASRFEHGPADLGMDVRALVVPVPRPHHVAVTEQLDALAAEHLHVARYQSVEYQEAAVVAFGLDRGACVPRPGPQREHARSRLMSGALQLVLVQQVGEVGVSVDDGDRRPRASFHRVGSITSSWGRTHADLLRHGHAHPQLR
jgi:hypothetical protein